MEKNQIQDFNARKTGKLPAFPTERSRSRVEIRSDYSEARIFCRESRSLRSSITSPVTNANVYPNFPHIGQSISDERSEVADTLLKRLG